MHRHSRSEASGLKTRWRIEIAAPLPDDSQPRKSRQRASAHGWCAVKATPPVLIAAWPESGLSRPTIMSTVPVSRIHAISACCSTASAGPCDGFHSRDHAPHAALPSIDELDEKAATREDSYDANLSQPANASCCVTSRPLTSIAATALTHAQPARLSECGKSQKRLATRRVSSTAAERAVMATILIRLRAAIDSVRFAFAFLHFDFCAHCKPETAGQAAWQLDPDAFTPHAQ